MKLRDAYKNLIFLLSSSGELVYSDTIYNEVNIISLIKEKEEFFKLLDKDIPLNNQIMHMVYQNNEYEFIFVNKRYISGNIECTLQVEQNLIFAFYQDFKVDLLECFNEKYLEYDPLAKMFFFPFSRDRKSISLEEIVNENINPFAIHLDDLKKLEEFVNYLVKDKKAKSFTIRSKMNSNKYHWYQIKFQVLEVDKGYFYIGKVSKEDEWGFEKEEMIKRANCDPLTGVLQKNAIAELINKKIEEKKSKFILIMLDIDLFKKINDEFGHSFGDLVIKTIIKKIDDFLGKKAVLGRFGGDEFIIFIDDVEQESEIKEICRTIKRLIYSIQFDEYKSFRVSATFGVVKYPENGNDFHTLFRKLDRALYRGKQKGRDCYIIYDEMKHAGLTTNDFGQDERKTLSSNFIAEVLNELINSVDITMSLSSVIEKIGKRYNLERILLYGKIKNRRYNVRYVSNEEFNRGFENFNYNETEKYFDYFNNEGLFVISNISHLEENQKDFFEYLKLCGTKSCVQIRLKAQNLLSGIISFEMSSKRRPWLDDNLLDFIILSKIISNFVVKEYHENLLNEYSIRDELISCWNLKGLRLKSEQLLIENEHKYAIVVFDISHFNHINENYGYDFGNKILWQIVNALDRFRVLGEFYCRVTDDKFAYLMFADEAEKTIARINEFIKIVNNIKLGKASYLIEIHAGVYFYNQDDSFIAGFDKANKARRVTKTKLEGNVTIFNRQLQDIESKLAYYETKMRSSLENGDFIVYYQPCFTNDGKRMVSIEALVRWNLDGQLISPDNFIPIFEHNGFIVDLDFYVYEETFKFMKSLIQEGKSITPISLNVSKYHLKTDNFIPRLKKLIDKYDIDPKMVCLEITEPLIALNKDKIQEFINQLRAFGIKIYLDDFGVAYSTLNLLSWINIDVIKLDRSFFAKDNLGEREKIILRSIINMAKQLNISLIAEGIENSVQLEWVKELECDYVQGYYFTKPMDFENIKNKYY